MATLTHLNALRAFEATARHLSFSGAAAELHVTPAAVGQQVRLLESYLEVELFTRAPGGSNRLVPTEVAIRALPDIRAGFDRMAIGLDLLKQGASHTLLNVTVSPAFAAKWLLPRIDRFQQQHPDIDLRLNTSQQILDFPTHGIDVGVRYGAGEWAGLMSVWLMGEEIHPVCSPQYRTISGAQPQSIEDLRECTLLHDLSMEHNKAFPTWDTFFQQVNLKGIDTARGLRINNSAAVLQAAIDKQGIALGRSVMVADDLAAGRLIRPFQEMVQPSQLGYYVVFRPECADLSKVTAFRDWLLGECAGSLETSPV
jgi:LysR family glycine cleavage system transcriptional activator